MEVLASSFLVSWISISTNMVEHPFHYPILSSLPSSVIECFCGRGCIRIDLPNGHLDCRIRELGIRPRRRGGGMLRAKILTTRKGGVIDPGRFSLDQCNFSRPSNTTDMIDQEEVKRRCSWYLLSFARKDLCEIGCYCRGQGLWGIPIWKRFVGLTAWFGYAFPIC